MLHIAHLLTDEGDSFSGGRGVWEAALSFSTLDAGEFSTSSPQKWCKILRSITEFQGYVCCFIKWRRRQDEYCSSEVGESEFLLDAVRCTARSHRRRVTELKMINIVRYIIRHSYAREWLFGWHSVNGILYLAFVHNNSTMIMLRQWSRTKPRTCWTKKMKSRLFAHEVMEKCSHPRGAKWPIQHKTFESFSFAAPDVEGSEPPRRRQISG